MGDEQRVVRQSDDHALTQRSEGRTLDRLARVLVDDPEHLVERFPARLMLCPAGQRFGDAIEIGNAALVVSGDHRIADAAKRYAEQLTAIARAGPCAAHALANSDDQGTREEIGNETDDGLVRREINRASWRDEEIRAGQIAEDDDEQCWAIFADPGGGRRGAEQRDQRKAVAQEWVEQPAEQHGAGKNEQ